MIKVDPLDVDGCWPGQAIPMGPTESGMPEVVVISVDRPIRCVKHRNDGVVPIRGRDWVGAGDGGYCQESKVRPFRIWGKRQRGDAKEAG